MTELSDRVRAIVAPRISDQLTLHEAANRIDYLTLEVDKLAIALGGLVIGDDHARDMAKMFRETAEHFEGTEVIRLAISEDAPESQAILVSAMRAAVGCDAEIKIPNGATYCRLSYAGPTGLLVHNLDGNGTPKAAATETVQYADIKDVHIFKRAEPPVRRRP